jgi:hypothetical protein
MADWNKPTIQSNYLDFVTEMNAKFNDAAVMFGFGGPTNIPVSTLRFNRSINLFDEWDGATWQPKVLSIAGGGTGSSNPAGIRVNLGLGSMSTQNANAVAITGGSITGVALDVSALTGIVPMARGGTGSALAGTVFGDVLLWNGAQIVLASGANLRALHASYLVEGTVPDARFPAHNAWIDRTQVFQGRQHFAGEFIAMGATGVYSATVHTSGPALNWMNPYDAVSLKITRVQMVGGNLYVQAVDDAYTSARTIATFRNDGLLEASGQLIGNINAYNITHGYINPNVLAPGPSSSTFLRGDNVWAVPSGGSGGGTPIPFPSGMISMFANGCPAGWTRVAAFDNRVPLGSTSYGQQGGNVNHSHSFSVNSTNDGGHSHSFYSGVGGRARGTVSGRTDTDDSSHPRVDGGADHWVTLDNHRHTFSANVDLAIEEASASGETSGVGNHYHQVYGNTSTTGEYPPYTTVFFCQKD